MFKNLLSMKLSTATKIIRVENNIAGPVGFTIYNLTSVHAKLKL